jgi:hypothetical protein
MPGLFHATLRRATRIAVAAGSLLAPAVPAGELPVSAIEFSPVVTANLQDYYGADEGAVLRAAILAAVSREAARVAIRPGLTVSVTVREVTPTYPTRQQLADDPAVDLTRAKFIGGAALAGEVRDANGQRLATVTYRHFPQTLPLGSASLDPWGDARLAIDQFAVKLAAVCHDLGAPGVRAPQRPRPHTAAG